MNVFRHKYKNILMILMSGIISFIPLNVCADDNPFIAIADAKAAIDKARMAGAEQFSVDDFSVARSWLLQAEKAYEATRSVMARLSTEKTKKARDEEVIYLATMAKVKALAAEAKANNQAASAKIKEAAKDLADYRSAIAVLTEKMHEAQKAKEVQAKAEAERRQLEETQRSAEQIEEQKRKELEDVKRKKAELEALKQNEAREIKLKEEKLIAEKESAASKAKLMEAQMIAQQSKEAQENRAREEKLAAEKGKVSEMQARIQALEKEKIMLISAGKIPKVTAEAGEKKIIMTIQVADLFASSNELSSAGRKVLDQVGDFLNSYPNNKIIVRGHTDSTGKPHTNQVLSEKRANKVREYLVANRNVSPELTNAEGVGSVQPVAGNESESGRLSNRRVELVVMIGKQ